jgi:hypothetical protein
MGEIEAGGANLLRFPTAQDMSINQLEQIAF